MKITIVTGPFLSLPPYSIGAVEKLWYAVGNNWIKQGHEVVFICKRPSAQTSSENCKYVNGFERTGSWTRDCILDLIYSICAARNIKKSDVLILNTLWLPLLVRFFKKKIKLRVFSVERFPKGQIRLYRIIGRINCFRCNSTAVYNAVIHQDNAAKPLCSLVPNFIDTTLFTPCRKRTRIADKSTVTIAYAGRINREKGLHFLCQAVNELNLEHSKRAIRIEFIGAYSENLGGSGISYVEELKQIADKSAVFFHDPIYDAGDLAKEMDKADLFCYPSIAIRGETFGVAALEAMGLGIPTIVTDLECFKDFVVPGENALVVHVEKDYIVNDLKNAILKLIDNDLIYHNISISGAFTAKKFNLDTISKKYIDEFKRLIDT